jgi:hypothetical protein
VRLIDSVFRQGHLSEAALVEAVMTGDRPAHLERCDVCAERAVELGRWLDEARDLGLESADAAFPAERLAAQQSQILRKLEQLDQPSRIIAFPSQTRLEMREPSGRRVAASWVGVAAAAGLIIGVVGGQITARMGDRPAPPPAAVATQTTPAPAPDDASATPVDSSLLDQDFDTIQLKAVEAIDDLTPRMTAAARIGG